jgi:outer membrane protein assembly factor BamB
MELKMRVLPGLLLLCVLLSGAAAGEPGNELAVFVLKTAGMNEGMCVVVDPGGSEVLVDLVKGSRMYVEGCSWDGASIASGRKALLSAGVAGRASLRLTEDSGLPYADNLINLVVAPNWGRKEVPVDELLRVLAPNGVGIVGNDGSTSAIADLEAKLKQAGVKQINALARKGWLSFSKPLNPDFGTWTNNAGGPDMSNVGDDKTAGPWSEVRWVGDPRWGALAGTYSGRVTGGGRIYYVESRTGTSWWVARDAYNGIELWRTPIEAKGWVPLGGPGNSLACDDRWTFATHKEVLIARDGKTGEIVKEYKSPAFPRNVTAIAASLLISDLARNIANFGRVAALEKESGRVTWTRPAAAHPAAADGVAFVLGKTELEGIDIAKGTTVWKTAMPKAEGLARVFYKGGIVYVTNQPNWKPVAQLAAFNAKSGEMLWADTTMCAKAFGIMAFGNEVCFAFNSKEQHCSIMDGLSGKVSRDYPIKGLNGKCYGFTGGGEYLMYGNCSYLDVKTGAETSEGQVRSPCFLGHVAANGLTYFLPHHCDCGITLRGFIAMSRSGSRKFLPDGKDGSSQLVASSAAPSPAPESPDDWPMYRKDTVRSNAATGKLPEQIKPLWSEAVGRSHITQAVAAYGVVCIAEPQTHCVFGRDAVNGKELWSFVADGRVEFPPSLHKGLCLFGTNAGSVYALDAKSGKEVWRLRAAPAEKFIGEEGQFASAWPVIGGVMPMNGEIYFTCGRSVAVDGGICSYAVDAATGKVRWRVKGGVSGGDFFLSNGKELYLTKSFFNIKDGARIGGPGGPNAKGILHTTHYLTYVSVADYMACVEPSLSSEKHIELTDGITTGENLAFNEKCGIGAWRYRFGVGPDLMKKDKPFQRFIYSRSADGAVKWKLDDAIKQQMMGVVLAGETAYLAGSPLDPKEKGELWVLSMADGKKLQTLPLEGNPVYDGMSAANGRLYVSTEDGRLMCFGDK